MERMTVACSWLAAIKPVSTPRGFSGVAPNMAGAIRSSETLLYDSSCCRHFQRQLPIADVTRDSTAACHGGVGNRKSSHARGVAVVRPANDGKCGPDRPRRVIHVASAILERRTRRSCAWIDSAPVAPSRPGGVGEDVTGTTQRCFREHLVPGSACGPSAGWPLGSRARRSKRAVDRCSNVRFSALVVGLAVPERRVSPRSIDAISFAAQQRAGLAFLRTDRLLFTMACQLTISNFLSGPLFSVVLAVYARDTYGTASGLGFLVAGLGPRVAAGGRSPTGPSVSISHAGRSGWSAIWFSRGLHGVAAAPRSVHCRRHLYRQWLHCRPSESVAGHGHTRANPVRPAGRVSATFTPIAQVAQPLGVALGGLAIDTVGFVPTVTALALATMTLALSLLVLPALRDLDAPPIAS